MSKFELTISSDYCKDWGVFQAIRELFQNSVDEEVQNPDNTSFFSYDEKTQELHIGNKKSTLDIQSLLLGVTTKSNDNSTIGQFGEGYKIATIVLLRTGHPITFYNYGNKEVWTTKLVKSRRYGGVLVPTFYVDKNFPWQSVPNNNLTIVVENITKEEYEEIKDKILQLQDNIGKTYHVDYYGDILLEERHKGKLYVSGLYVCSNPRINFGYNMTPISISLDRDRQTISDFDLLWNTSKMWKEYMDTKEFNDVFYSNNNDDMLYIDSMTKFENLNAVTKKTFYELYGEDAIPVTSQEEYNRVKELGGNPVFVNKLIGSVFRNIYDGFTSKYIPTKTAYTAFKEWFEELTDTVDVPEELKVQFENLMEEYEDDLR